MKPKHHLQWHDAQRWPREKPNPAYPDGVDLDIAEGAMVSCKVALPYPAKRCGAWFITCRQCGLTAAVTTAGRPDDPRSVTLPCKFDA